jgi:HNH endonuclease
MNYWSFKIADQQLYSDELGKTYVYDNTHSVKVAPGDRFVYLEKRGHGKLCFLGAGEIADVKQRPAAAVEQHSDRVTRVFTAVLSNVEMFATPIDISRAPAGMTNRVAIGLSANLNNDGLSLSMKPIAAEWYFRILALANYAGAPNGPPAHPATGMDWDDVSGSEGNPILVTHKRRERRPGLVARKKELVLHQTGKLECEVCGFNFATRYGEFGSDYIECHHIVPLADAKPGQMTRLTDLALVCANCHRILHRSGASIEELRAAWLKMQPVSGL